MTELHYQPPLQFFAAALAKGPLLLEQHENYQKQSYRNRCAILTSNGPQTLVIPVQHEGRKVPIREVKIDYSQRWVEPHWRTIRSAYGSAPYYIYYAPYLEQVYKTRPEHLFELNLELLKVYLKLLHLNIEISFTSSFQTNYPPTVVDYRNLIHPKRPPDNLIAEPYVQVFGRPFVPGLSILDLLFNLGPESVTYLQRQARGF